MTTKISNEQTLKLLHASQSVKRRKNDTGTVPFALRTLSLMTTDTSLTIFKIAILRSLSKEQLRLPVAVYGKDQQTIHTVLYEDLGCAFTDRENRSYCTAAVSAVAKQVKAVAGSKRQAVSTKHSSCSKQGASTVYSSERTRE